MRSLDEIRADLSRYYSPDGGDEEAVDRLLEDLLAAAAEVERLTTERERLRESDTLADALGCLWLHAPTRRAEVRETCQRLNLTAMVDR